MAQWEPEDSTEQELAPPVSVRLPKALMRRVEKMASLYGISVAQQLRLFIRIGAQVQELFPRSLEETIDLLQNVDFEALERVRGKTAIHLLRKRIESVLSELDLGVTAPTFFLAVAPVNPGSLDIPTLFSSDDAEIVKLLEQPPTFRRSGFGLDTEADARIISGQRRKAIIPKHKSLDLWRDGTLVFAVDGGIDFLCWGRTNLTKKMQALQINQLALIESAYLFLDLTGRVFKYARPEPNSLEFQLGLLNMSANQSFCKLAPGPLPKIDFRANAKEAPGSNEIFTVSWNGGEFDPGEVAYRLVKEVYVWFGWTEKDIPYSKKVGDHRVIDSEAIKNPERHFGG